MQAVLIDTSVWSEHFRRPQALLATLLSDGLAVTHEMVIQELALSMAAQNLAILDDIIGLGLLPTVTLEEYLKFFSSNKIAGQKIGCVDTNLLASCKLAAAGLYTLDKHLSSAARACNIEVIEQSA